MTTKSGERERFRDAGSVSIRTKGQQGRVSDTDETVGAQVRIASAAW